MSGSEGETIQSWWGDVWMRIAASFNIADTVATDRFAFDGGAPGKLLVTHGGLTVGAWWRLGQPQTVDEMVTVLNQTDDPVVWREGGATSGLIDFSAGPNWALAVEEVYRGWARVDSETYFDWGIPKFPQAHGHTSPYLWQRGNWRPPLRTCEERAIATLAVDLDRSATRVRVGERTYFGTAADSGREVHPIALPTLLKIGDKEEPRDIATELPRYPRMRLERAQAISDVFPGLVTQGELAQLEAADVLDKARCDAAYRRLKAGHPAEQLPHDGFGREWQAFTGKPLNGA